MTDERETSVNMCQQQVIVVLGKLKNIFMVKKIFQREMFSPEPEYSYPGQHLHYHSSAAFTTTSINNNMATNSSGAGADCFSFNRSLDEFGITGAGWLAGDSCDVLGTVHKWRHRHQLL